MSLTPDTMVKILRQTAESESFRYVVERRHLISAADIIEQLQAAVSELEVRCIELGDEVEMAEASAKQADEDASREIAKAKYEAERTIERELRDEWRGGMFADDMRDAEDYDRFNSQFEE